MEAELGPNRMNQASVQAGKLPQGCRALNGLRINILLPQHWGELSPLHLASPFTTLFLEFSLHPA